jgi:hypothetical protein
MPKISKPSPIAYPELTTRQRDLVEASPWVSLREAGVMLGARDKPLSSSAVQAAVDRGELLARHVGSRIFVSVPSIVALKRANMPVKIVDSRVPPTVLGKARRQPRILAFLDEYLEQQEREKQPLENRFLQAA